MIVINNFDSINPHLSYESDEDFYFLQIIKRRKDNPDLERSEKTIRNFYLYQGDIEKFKDTIIKLCIDNNARAYLYLNKRNIKDVVFEANVLLAGYMKSGTYKAIHNLMDKAIGNKHSDNEKKWILDIDSKDDELVSRYLVTAIESNPPGKFHLYNKIETLNGYHLITTPFNTEKFSQLCAMYKLDNIEIHKDNPTLLYFYKC